VQDLSRALVTVTLSTQDPVPSLTTRAFLPIQRRSQENPSLAIGVASSGSSPWLLWRKTAWWEPLAVP